MRLKRVEITGFKSFMEKTCIVFERGITAVVGPNGCGKSNVVDAIRWAMGEHSAKSLRGRVMEDVIFNGSEAYKPVGMAEVKLIFENTNGHTPPSLAGCSEIEVSRRLFRSGESEYSINRVPCRRRDVRELFMDTGLGNRSFTIVEQGKVTQIVHAKPEERRVLIEELAGISKYKSRREAAQRKMEATRQNLIRLQDIRREVAQQIRSLERQAQQARRYKRLRSEILEVERGLLLREWLSFHRRLRSLEEEREGLEGRLQSVVHELQLQEGTLEERKLSCLQKERLLSDGREELYQVESRIRELESRIHAGKEELQGLEELRDMLEEEIRNLQERVDEARTQEDRLRRERSSLEMETRAVEERVRKCTEDVSEISRKLGLQERALQEAKDALVEWMSERATLRNSLEHHRRRMQELDRALIRYRMEEEGQRDRQKELQKELCRLEQRLQEEQYRLEQIKERRLLLEDRLSRLREERQKVVEVEGELRKNLRDHESRRAALQELQDGLAGFTEGVKFLRELHRRGDLWEGRPLRVVAEVLEISEQYEAALAGCLGDRLQYLVVREPEEVLEVLPVLRREGCGRVGFVPLEAKSSTRKEGSAAKESPRVQWSSGYEALHGPLVEDVVVVNDLQEGIRRWRSDGKCLYVTREGDVIHPTGIVEIGGTSHAAAQYIKRRREIRDLSAQIDTLSRQLGEWEEKEEEIIRDLEVGQRDLEELGEEIHRTEIQLAEDRQDRRRLEGEAQALLRRLEVLEVETKEAQEERQEEAEALERDAGRLSQVEERIRAGEEGLQRLQKGVLSLKEELKTAEEKRTQAKMDLVSMRERLNALEREHLRWKEDLQTLQEQIHRKTEQLQQGIRRSEELGSRIRRDQDELQRNLVYHDRLRQKVEGLRRDLEEGQSALRGLEEICHSRRKAVRELERGISELDLKIQDIEIRMEHLEAELTGRLELSRQEIEERSRSLSAGDVEKEREELQRLRSALERLGEVNLMAVEQYEELRQRYDYLTGQQEDLEESIRSLQKAIQRINRVSRRRFREAFQALNREFQKVFPLLFEGGEAQLLLTESPDLLEAGVDIVARPPGKRLQNISLLSGGEKALTAVALIFAMIRVKPTPFCLFDEVDAPLDDANIDRFNQMIKELAKDSQFILVTHNKRTMEMADALYGITMESPGVSKLISVRLH